MQFVIEKQKELEQVIEILVEEPDEMVVTKLKELAARLGINLERESIDNWLGVTILYDYKDGLDGLVSGEDVYLHDLEDLAKETGSTKDNLNDNVFFGVAPEANTYNGGFYAGGVTVYHYQQLCDYLNNQNDVCNFNNTLIDLGITQKVFCGRVGVTEQAVSKWKRTCFPKWVWYALKGMKQ